MFQFTRSKTDRECRKQNRRRMIGETQAFLNKHLRSRNHNYASRRTYRDKTDPRPQVAPNNTQKRNNPSPNSPKIGVWLSVDMPFIDQPEALFMNRFQNRLNRLADPSMRNDVLIDVYTLGPMSCRLVDLIDDFRRRLKTQNRDVILLVNATIVPGPEN